MLGANGFKRPRVNAQIDRGDPRLSAGRRPLCGADLIIAAVLDTPVSLERALDAFDADAVVRGALGDTLAAHFVAGKRAEWLDYACHVGAWKH